MLWTFAQYYDAYMKGSHQKEFTFIYSYNMFHSNYLINTPDMIFKSNITFDKPFYQRAKNRYIENNDGIKYKKDEINQYINICIPDNCGLIYFGNTVHAYCSELYGLGQTEHVWKIVEQYNINYANPSPEEMFLLKMAVTNQ